MAFLNYIFSKKYETETNKPEEKVDYVPDGILHQALEERFKSIMKSGTLTPLHSIMKNLHDYRVPCSLTNPKII